MMVELDRLTGVRPLVGFTREPSKKIDVRLVISIMFFCSSVAPTWRGLFDDHASFGALVAPGIFLGLCAAALSAPLDTTATLTQKSQSLGAPKSAARRQIARGRRRQAGVLVMNDAFLLGPCVCFRLAIAVRFARSKEDPAAHASHPAMKLDGGTAVAEHR